QSVKEVNGDLMIYSFDYDLDMNIMTLLKEMYDITGPNTAVFNEVIHLEEIDDSGDVTRYLM
ncbi:MAG: hypothetical protein KKB31_01525, partial [Nanoarchaeota archaeon]|nr:hypothetical protein [Nanoarchaeota archaeon]